MTSFQQALEEHLAAIWNAPEYINFRDDLCGDKPQEICRSCAVYNGVF